MGLHAHLFPVFFLVNVTENAIVYTIKMLSTEQEKLNFMFFFIGVDQKKHPNDVFDRMIDV
jgi:hypothetical protein